MYGVGEADSLQTAGEELRMDSGRCHGCGDERRLATVLSAHRTSQGTVVYDRCRCGRAGVRLVRTSEPVALARTDVAQPRLVHA